MSSISGTIRARDLTRASSRSLNRLRAPAALAAIAVLSVVLFRAGRASAPVSTDALITLGVFLVAVAAWTCTDLDDTYVALSAALALVMAGVLPAEGLLGALGDDTIWLLLGGFVMAAGVTRSGLADRAAAALVVTARSPRQLVHLLTFGLVVTAFAIPSTSGRAALAVPVLVALARVLEPRRRLIKALAVAMPTVILLSAVGSLLGAGAHLVTSQVLHSATGEGFGFGGWLLLGLPLAVVSSHAAAEIVLLLFSRRDDRAVRFRMTHADLARDAAGTPVSGPLTGVEWRALAVVAGAVALWCTESLHGVEPAVVAVLGAVLAGAPRIGTVDLSAAVKDAPWSLLLFLAATLALGAALVSTGAAEWLAGGLLGSLGTGRPVLFLVLVVVLSTALHLVVQSRSARSAVLVPLVIALAPAAGVAPAAAAFASTAAAGFCHTLPSSAKPVAMFARLDGVETYDRRDLLRLSTVLAPVHVALVLAFALVVWPHLGLPLGH